MPSLASHFRQMRTTLLVRIRIPLSRIQPCPRCWMPNNECHSTSPLDWHIVDLLDTTYPCISLRAVPSSRTWVFDALEWRLSYLLSRLHDDFYFARLTEAVGIWAFQGTKGTIYPRPSSKSTKLTSYFCTICLPGGTLLAPPCPETQQAPSKTASAAVHRHTEARREGAPRPKRERLQGQAPMRLCCEASLDRPPRQQRRYVRGATVVRGRLAGVRWWCQRR